MTTRTPGGRVVPGPGRGGEYARSVTSLQPQFRTGPWTFLLDGRVVEWFHEGTSESNRVHVDFFRIDGEPSGSDLKIRWGIEVSGRIINGGRLVIPSAQISEFQEFVARAIGNRTPGYRP